MDLILHITSGRESIEALSGVGGISQYELVSRITERNKICSK